MNEKEALNYLFLIIPLLNVTIPFFWKSFAVVWSADTVAFFAMYAWKVLLLLNYPVYLLVLLSVSMLFIEYKQTCFLQLGWLQKTEQKKSRCTGLQLEENGATNLK